MGESGVRFAGRPVDCDRARDGLASGARRAAYACSKRHDPTRAGGIQTHACGVQGGDMLKQCLCIATHEVEAEGASHAERILARRGRLGIRSCTGQRSHQRFFLGLDLDVLGGEHTQAVAVGAGVVNQHVDRHGTCNGRAGARFRRLLGGLRGSVVDLVEVFQDRLHFGLPCSEVDHALGTSARTLRSARSARTAGRRFCLGTARSLGTRDRKTGYQALVARINHHTTIGSERPEGWHRVVAQQITEHSLCVPLHDVGGDRHAHTGVFR